MKIVLYIALPLAMAATACSTQGDDPSGTPVEDAAGRTDARTVSAGNPTAGAAAGPAARAETSRSITLTGFSCGDSCYLEFTDGGEAKTALCRATQCSEWADAQALPEALKGKRATARFGTGNQVDATGNIMSRDFLTVEKLSIVGDGAGLRLDPAMRKNAPVANASGNSSNPGSADEAPAPPQRSSRDEATVGSTVPVRFRGLFAVDRKACAEDYTYNPAFQNVTVKARSVSFFETGGPVTSVNIQGDMAAITLRESVGDGVFTRAIYLALDRDGTVRYRPSKSEPVRRYVRC